jgi:hypothetical protein
MSGALRYSSEAMRTFALVAITCSLFAIACSEGGTCDSDNTCRVTGDVGCVYEVRYADLHGCDSPSVARVTMEQGDGVIGFSEVPENPITSHCKELCGPPSCVSCPSGPCN